MKKTVVTLLVLFVLSICYAVPIDYRLFPGQRNKVWVLITKTKFNTDGQITYQQSTDDTEVYSTYEDGLLIKESFSDGNNYYEYDDNNHLIHTHWSTGNESWYEYDQNGNQIKEIDKSFNSRKGIYDYNSYEYEYDNMGNIIKDSMRTFEYSYDSLGRIINKKEDWSFFTFEFSYTYDNKGNKISEVYSHDGSKETTDYEYDSNNNCTHEIDSSGDEYFREYNSKNEMIHFKKVNRDLSKCSEKWFEYSYYPNGSVKEMITYTHY